MAEELATSLSSSMNDGAQFYDYLSSITNKEIIIFDRNGIIVSDSVLEFKTGMSIPNEWLSSLKTGEEFNKERFDPNTYEKFFFSGQPIVENNEFNGGVIVFSSIDKLHESMHDVRDWIFGSIAGAILLALAYSFFLATRISRPLLKIEQATREISKGNLKTRVQIKSKDEIGSLAEAINDLSIELNNYRVNRSELLANISHELRTPISYLKGYSQIINSGQYRNEEELKTYSEIIEKESTRLAKLIQELFELSKMEEGKINLYIQSVDLEDVIESAIQKVTLKAKEKDIDLLFEIEETLPSIISDGLRIEQILLNLLENAINYTEHGSILVKVNKEKEFILISVEDTGIGIPEEEIRFIFDRFHRVEKSRARQMGGTGLGLAIVHELIKHLQGEIKVESKFGKGSRFIVKLPYELKTLG
ncbi:ATP-binding protein [Ureibacillus chungkukjangi]|uniref:sensor histidine kinase n=1 Tax=Ureibacillus chungkukjangi TaxID=1202712 RepID=UPI00203A9466|nr:sensor histidine kinase [Ureibacillus chungkukjangi]MCM3389324.1 ATP-binding protein [Ureibacillus chungkukjangi]